jgi:hypothetical protein
VGFDELAVVFVEPDVDDDDPALRDEDFGEKFHGRCLRDEDPRVESWDCGVASSSPDVRGEDPGIGLWEQRRESEEIFALTCPAVFVTKSRPPRLIKEISAPGTISGWKVRAATNN